MPPPPPPPPAAPPPPTASAPPAMTKDRGALLSSIEGFKKGKLKKAQTVDKSGPVLSNKPTAAAPAVSPGGAPGGGARPSGGAGAAAAPAASPMALGGMGGMFAGGVPRLRKTGLPGSSTMLPADSATATPVPTPAPAAIPKVTPPANNVSQAPLQPVRAAPAIPVAQPVVTPPSKPTPVVSAAIQSPVPTPVPAAIPPRPAQPSSVVHSSAHAAHSSSSGGECVLAAIYPFNAIRDHDLSLRVGDVIVNVNKSPVGGGNGNWWEGKCLHTGTNGMFPSNYVKELTSGEHGVVLFSYSGTRQDELSITAGQTIEILLHRDSGWWLARSGSQLGLVPYNYVQLN